MLLEKINQNMIFNYFSQRLSLTYKVLKLLDKIRTISCSLYGDKLMKFELTELGRKKSSFSDIKILNFAKTKNSHKFSINLSKINSIGVSNDVTSIVGDIHYILNHKKKSIFKKN